MSRLAKKTGPELSIKHPGLKPCTCCQGGVARGALYEFTCAMCNALGWVQANGDPIPEDEANNLLGRLAHSLARENDELRAENNRLRPEKHLGSPFD